MLLDLSETPIVWFSPANNPDQSKSDKVCVMWLRIVEVLGKKRLLLGSGISWFWNIFDPIKKTFLDIFQNENVLKYQSLCMDASPCWNKKLSISKDWVFHKLDPVTSSENSVWSENCTLATWPNDEVIYFSSTINGTNTTNVRKKQGLKNTFGRECSLWDFSSGRRTTNFLSYLRSLFLLYISSLTDDDLVFLSRAVSFSN